MPPRAKPGVPFTSFDVEDDEIAARDALRKKYEGTFKRSNALSAEQFDAIITDLNANPEGFKVGQDLYVVGTGDETTGEKTARRLFTFTKLGISGAGKANDVAGLFLQGAQAAGSTLAGTGFACAGAVVNGVSFIKDTVVAVKAHREVHNGAMADMEGPLKDYNLCLVKSKRNNAIIGFLSAGMDVGNCIADIATSGASAAITAPLGAGKNILLLGAKLANEHKCDSLKDLMNGNTEDKVDKAIAKAETRDDGTGALSDAYKLTVAIKPELEKSLKATLQTHMANIKESMRSINVQDMEDQIETVINEAFDA